ncbi:MAG: BON domain-containing protein [Moraxellaceae bacterium]|nr:BON domain-containing protein [Moraxellaceae bacterium]MDZ4386812.1 BON domain-containing protein [Moraxellaceae bacterium]
MHKPSLTILLAVAVSTAGCTSMAKVGIGPNPAEAGTRTISDRLTDSQLAQAIRRDIYRDIPSARDARIVVVSFYQAVLIVGEAQTEEMKQAVSNAARNYKDVVIVHNEMTVGPNRTLGQRLSDDLLERKAGINLFAADNLRSEQARVVAVNGTVYLMGKLTQRETDRAIQRIQALDGVTRIIKIVDVLPETPTT